MDPLAACQWRSSAWPSSSRSGRALRDLRGLVTTPMALLVAAVFVVASVWAIASFPRALQRPAAVEAPPLTADQQIELERWWDVQPKAPSFPFAMDGAKVLIVEFADFQCPHCRQMYFAYKPIMEKQLAAHPKDVKFLFKTWPLSSGCNASVPGVHFSATC